MSIGSILLGLALVVIVVPFVAGPFLKNGQRRKTPLESRPDDSPRLAKQSALAALRDLDFDFRTGKIAEEDYAPLRQRLLVQAAETDQAVEAGQPAVDDEIEAAVRALRGPLRAARRAACPHCHASVSDDDRFCPKCGAALGVALRPEAQGAACPQCHSLIGADDKFCARCGATLKSEGEIPGGLALMLHAWDEQGETVMLDGKADSSGAFRFENVPLQDGWVFAAMLAYKDVTFFSESAEVKPETNELALPLIVYETTSAASAVRISQMHVFLDFVPGKLTVGEIYILSNAGDRAVVGGLTLADGKAATLQFTLPAEANEVRFEGNDTARFVITPEGFADTGAVLPGEGTAQVVVTYNLPYASGMTLAHAVNQPVKAANVLMRADAGVTLAGDGLSEPTPRQVQTGETFNIYAAGSLAPGESLAVTLTGEPTYRMADGLSGAATEASAPGLSATVNRWAIPIAGGILGVALIAVGVWWWRRSGRPGTETGETLPDDDWSSVVQAIAALDEAHERGEMAEEDYRSRRAELRGRARAVLQAQEAIR